jgi:integrase/recombinase XerC
VLAEYDIVLGRSALSDSSRRLYRSRVSGYLRWLTETGMALPRDPFGDASARNDAVREYRIWLKDERQLRPSTINAALTALDHFYTHLQLGPVPNPREELDSGARRILDVDEQREFLRAVEKHLTARDKAVAYALFYTGLRVAELVMLDLPHLRRNADNTLIAITMPPRELPLEEPSGPVLGQWLDERQQWTNAGRTPAVFINQRGGRLSDRSVDDLIVRTSSAAGLNTTSNVTPKVLRRTFAHRMVRRGTDLERLADLLGHRRLDTTRRYLATG